MNKKFQSGKNFLIALCLLGTGGVIQDLQAQAPMCSTLWASDNYTNTNGFTWLNQNNGNQVVTNATYTQAGNGTMQMVWGGMNFNAVRGGVENRTYRNLPAPGLDNNNWTADFTFSLNTVSTAAISNGPGHYLVAFTSGTQDPIASSATSQANCPSLSNYPMTNEHAIMVCLNSTTVPIHDTDVPSTGGSWYFSACSKYGTANPTSSAGIPFPNAVGGPTVFYIRVQRTWSQKGLLRVY
ncbi:MAG TPA: hypothetical protein VNZ86_19550, partial [Bacteroidia bacterium]|nr:hypothetical protein [Bacteroidia bacterium]